MKKIIGFLIVLSSTILYASLTPLLKKANQKIPPFMTIAISMFIMSLITLIMSLIFEGNFILKIKSQRESVLILLAVGLINTLGFWLAIKGYKYMPVWQQTMFGILGPVFSGIFAYFILKEVLSPRLFLGLLIMALGLFIAVK